MLVGLREGGLENQIRDIYRLVHYLVQTQLPLERYCLNDQLRAGQVGRHNVAAVQRHEGLPRDVSVRTNDGVRHAVDEKLGRGLQAALALALDEVEAAEVRVGHADRYAAVVLQADGLDSVEGLQVDLVHRRFIFEEDEGKPKSTKFKGKVNSFSRFVWAVINAHVVSFALFSFASEGQA